MDTEYHAHSANLPLLAAKQEPYKKAYLLTKNIGRIFWKKKVQENGPSGRKKIKQKE